VEGESARLLYICDECGLPFLGGRSQGEAEGRCPECASGDPSLPAADPEVAVATEAEVCSGLDGSWEFVRGVTLSGYLDNLVAQVRDRVLGAPASTRVVLIDEPQLRTLALPSGMVLVSTGLMRFLEDEAELVFVLAHEVAHASSGVAAERLVRSSFGAVAGQRGADQERTWVSAALDMARLGYSRPREREADSRAIEAMIDLRYDPEAALRFLGRLSDRVREGDPSVGELVAAHPPPGYRIREIRRALHGKVESGSLLRVNREVFRRVVWPDIERGSLIPVRLSEALVGSESKKDRRQVFSWIVRAALGASALAAIYFILRTLLS
jgi:hypothetical protein